MFFKENKKAKETIVGVAGIILGVCALISIFVVVLKNKK